MANRRDHHVAGRVRVRVQDRQAVLGAVDRLVRGVLVARGGGRAEDAPSVPGAGDVLDAPRRPQRSLAHGRATLPAVFHVELRQFPHQARAFNLTREQLDGQSLAPWISGAPTELDDRRWSLERAKLTIYERPY